MFFTARPPAALAVILLLAACGHSASPPAASADPRPMSPAVLQPSPNRLVGRVLARDAARGFAFVELAAEPPPGALVDGAELVARTDDLRETARLRVSRYVRGRTLGAEIVSGQPSPGDEVVFRAP